MYKFKIYTKGKNHACVFYGNPICEISSSSYTLKEFSEILDTSKVVIECTDVVAVKPIVKAIVASLGRTNNMPEFRIINANINQLVLNVLEPYEWKEK